MKISVHPLAGAKLPPEARTVSSIRTDVVPTATMRLFCDRAALSFSAASAGRSYHSACILCADRFSTLTGANVPSPTCSVTVAVSTLASLSRLSSSSEKCSPAVGAATAPGREAYIVW